jgi:hypothetical protein
MERAPHASLIRHSGFVIWSFSRFAALFAVFSTSWQMFTGCLYTPSSPVVALSDVSRCGDWLSSLLSGVARESAQLVQ